MYHLRCCRLGKCIRVSVVRNADVLKQPLNCVEISCSISLVNRRCTTAEIVPCAGIQFGLVRFNGSQRGLAGVSGVNQGQCGLLEFIWVSVSCYRMWVNVGFIGGKVGQWRIIVVLQGVKSVFTSYFYNFIFICSNQSLFYFYRAMNP